MDRWEQAQGLAWVRASESGMVSGLGWAKQSGWIHREIGGRPHSAGTTVVAAAGEAESSPGTGRLGSLVDGKSRRDRVAERGR